MTKYIVFSFAFFALLIMPAQTKAATLDLQTLSNQLQTLSAQFDALKMRGDKASSTPKVKNASSTVDRTCMATAVSVRETSIATAWTSFNTKMVTALSDRKTGLIDAWNMTDGQERNQAIKAAWKAWKTDKKSINTSLKNDRKAAWDTFKSTAKTSCKVETPKEEGLEKTSADSIAL
jgi:hypothetical protein